LVRFNNLDQSTAINNGALVIRGGVGILKNLNVGQDFKVFGKTVFEGPVTFNAGLIPETIESAYIGVSTLPWASAWIAGVGIATEGVPGGTEDQDRTIRALTGNLILNSSSGITSITDNLEVGASLLIKGNTRLQGTLQVDDGIIPDSNESAYLGSATTSFTEAYVAEINIGVGGTAKIGTRTGNLILTSVGGKTEIVNDLVVNNTLKVVEGVVFNDTAVFDSDILPSTTTSSNNAALGSLTRKFKEAHIDEVRVGHSGDSEIDTASGDLILDAATKQVTVDSRLTVNQTSIFTGIVTVTNGIVPLVTEGCGIGLENRRFSEAHIDNIRIGVSGQAIIDTRAGALILDSAFGTVEIDDKLDVNETLNVDGRTYLSGLTTVATGLVPHQDEGAYLGTELLPFSEAWVGEIAIATGTDTDQNDRTIKTVSGRLYLDSFDGTVEVDDNLDINNNLNVDSNVVIAGITSVSNGLFPTTQLACGIGSVGKRFTEAHIDDIRIAVSAVNEIDTRTGALVLDSAFGTVEIDDKLDVNETLNVDGRTYLSGLTTVATGLVPATSYDSYLGNEEKQFGQSWIGDIKISTNNDRNEITTKNNKNLILNSESGTVEVDDNLDVNGTLNVDETSTFKKRVTIDVDIVPDESLGAKIGTELLPFSDAHIGNIQIAYGVDGVATDDDNLISTKSGNLKLDGKTSNVSISNDLVVSRNLRVSGITTFENNVFFATALEPRSNEGASLGSQNLTWSEAYIDAIFLDSNRITSRTDGSGNGQKLLIEGSNNIVETSFDFLIGRNLNTTGISTFTNKVNLGNNILPTSTTGASLGESDKVFSAAYIDNLVLNDNVLSTSTGKLVLDGGNNQVEIGTDPTNDRLNVVGLTTFTNDVIIRALSKTFSIRNSSGAEKFKVTTDEGDTTIAGSLLCNATTTTTNLTVTGQNSTTTHATIGSALRKTPSTSFDSGSLVVFGGAGIQDDLYVGKTVNVGTALTVRTTLFVSGTSTFTGSIKANAGLDGNAKTATTATHIVGSTVGAIPYQTGTNLTTSSDLLTFVGGASPELRCKGDIVAFFGSSSDDRLKENKEKLDNALDKVISLSGFTYTWNEKAISLGFNNSDSCVGVSAQEVQKVLPEAVIEREFNGENILLVKYEKIVPLLIEAIKELNDKVERLQSLLDK